MAEFIPDDDGPVFTPDAPAKPWESAIAKGRAWLDALPGMQAKGEQLKADAAKGVGENVKDFATAAATDPRTTLALAPGIGKLGELAARAGLPAVAGRVAASGALGGAQAALDPKASLGPGWVAVIDAAVAGLTEGAVTGAGKGLAKLGKSAAEFTSASSAPSEAFAAIKARLPSGKWITAPTLGKGTLSAEDAVKKLAGLKGADYQQARKELAHEFDRLDMQRISGPRPHAGEVFSDRTAASRTEPAWMSRAADTARRALTSDEGRAVANAAAITPVGGVPLGAIAALALGGAHIPGGRMVESIIGQAGH